MLQFFDGAGRLTRVTGKGTRGFNGDGGPAVTAELGSPEGVAVDSGRILYIADSLNHCTRKASNGTVATVARNGSPSDHSGAVIPDAISVPVLNLMGRHASYSFPELAGKGRKLGCASDTLVSAVGLRFIGAEAFTTLPVIVQ
jgi:hypothetical protein